MSTLIALLLVFVAAATPWLEVFFVVPAAILAGLPVGPTIVIATLGNVATLVPAVLLSDRLRARVRRRRGGADDPPSRRQQRSRQLFDRYGLPGLALLGPLITGIHLAALVAVGAGAPRRATILWLSGGVAIWSLVLGIATLIGIDALIDPDSLPDLFADRYAPMRST